MTDKKLIAAMRAIIAACPDLTNAQRADLAARVVMAGGVKIDAFGNPTFTDAARAIEPRMPSSDFNGAVLAAHDANIRASRNPYERAAAHDARIAEVQSQQRGVRDPDALRAELATLKSKTDEASKLRASTIADTLISMGQRINPRNDQ